MEPKNHTVRKRVKVKKKNFLSREISGLKHEMRWLSSFEIIIFLIVIIIFVAGIFHQVIYEYFAK